MKNKPMTREEKKHFWAGAFVLMKHPALGEPTKEAETRLLELVGYVEKNFSYEFLNEWWGNCCKFNIENGIWKCGRK